MHTVRGLTPALVLLLGGVTTARAQADPRGALRFETAGAAGIPAGWAGTARRLFTDSTVVRSAPYAARLEGPPAADSATILSLSAGLPVTFAGDTLELRGWLRREGVASWTGLWLRLDNSRGRPVQFDNMARRQLAGSQEWTEYRIRLPLDTTAVRVFLGALVVGPGRVWVDDLELLVDGKPVAEAPRVSRPVSVADADTQYRRGSPIATRTLNARQVQNLVLLGKVWGFAKYHHPRIAGGGVNWDMELFRVMPAVLDAPDRAAAAAALAGWLARLGEPPPCSPCAQLPADLQQQPTTAWIRDVGLLGPALATALERIYRNRPAGGRQYYVSFEPNVRNPNFAVEDAYPRAVPDAGFRLLALYRFWNIIEYWYPYRHLLADEWDQVLAEFVPRLMAAGDSASYRLELMQLSARIQDTHSNLWEDLGLRPPGGAEVDRNTPAAQIAQLPVSVRFIGGKAVVTEYLHPVQGPATGLQPGDVIETLDGARVDSLVAAWRRYYSASNEPTRLRDIGRALTRGHGGSVRLGVERGGRRLALTAARSPLAQLDRARMSVHDLPGETFQRLSDDVAYLKLSSVKVDSLATWLARARDAKVLVIDIRNYPSEFVVFALGQHLVPAPTPFALFTTPDASNPGAFSWQGPVTLTPAQPHFTGRIVILVDEVSQSQAEYTAMALRTAPGAIVVGSTTAGADGNISRIPLPGGTASMISGIGVFYPDRRGTQRVGIVPDLEVVPTIAGIRAGRDEVLEAGVSRALGRRFTLPPRAGRIP